MEEYMTDSQEFELTYKREIRFTMTHPEDELLHVLQQALL